jgi:hypothetical protein
MYYMCIWGQLLWGKTLHIGDNIAPIFGEKIDVKNRLKPLLPQVLNEFLLKKTLARSG